jgi:hypothetical protein
LIDPFPMVLLPVNLAERLVVPATGAVTSVPPPEQFPNSCKQIVDVVPVKSGKVYVCAAVRLPRVIVPVWVVPNTNSLVSAVKFKLAKVGAEAVPMFCGKDSVTPPVAPDTVT